MDPNVTLLKLIDAKYNRQWDEVLDLAQALTNWVRGGGFPPGNLTTERTIQFCNECARMAWSIGEYPNI